MVEHFEQILRGHLGHVSEDVDGKLTPENGSQYKRSVALLREVPQPTRDHVVDGLRQDEGRSRRRVETAFCLQQTHDLADEERIALSLLVNGANKLIARRLTADELDVPRNVPLV